MSAYIYTPRTEVKELSNGQKIARLGFAYKDFDCFAPPSWFRSAAVQESAGGRAAEKHNANGVTLLAMGDKFEDGIAVFEVEGNMRFKYLDYDFKGLKQVGVLRKNGRKFYVEYK